MAGDPRHKAGDASRQQGGHAEPGVDHEDFVGLQGCSRLRDGSAVQIGFPLVVGVGPQEHTDQREADCADRADRCAYRQDDGWEGVVGPGLVVRPDTPPEPRAAEADQVTGHRADPFIPMGLPAAFLLDHLMPRLYEGLDGPASIRQRRARSAHSLCRQSPVGQRREDGASTEQASPREQRPE
jgi:hypothetical protein